MNSLNISACLALVGESNIPIVLTNKEVSPRVGKCPLDTQDHATHLTNHDCSLVQVSQ